MHNSYVQVREIEIYSGTHPGLNLQLEHRVSFYMCIPESERVLHPASHFRTQIRLLCGSVSSRLLALPIDALIFQVLMDIMLHLLCLSAC